MVCCGKAVNESEGILIVNWKQLFDELRYSGLGFLRGQIQPHAGGDVCIPRQKKFT